MTILPSISQMNQRCPGILTASGLAFIALMISIYGWLGYQVTSPLAAINTYAHYVGAGLATIGLLAATVYLVILLNDPKRRNRRKR